MKLTEKEKNEIAYYWAKDEMYNLKKMCYPLIKQKNLAQLEDMELLSDALNVLYECIERFDSDKGVLFKTFLYGNIKRSFKDWTRDRMRDKRVNYAKDKNGNFIYEEYEVNGKKRKRKIIVKPLPLDAVLGEGKLLCETIASDFNIEDFFIKGSDKLETYLSNLTIEQRKLAILLSRGYKKKEILHILNITSKKYQDLFFGLKTYKNISILFKD